MEVRLDHSLYPRDAIAMAVGAFSEACEFVEAETPGATILRILPREGAPPETPSEFLSYALSAALEMRMRTDS